MVPDLFLVQRTRIQRTITDVRIHNIAYRLYGITEEERRIIEGVQNNA